MPADVIVAQSVRCAIVNSETSWNCAESLEERELDRSLSMCANREYVRVSLPDGASVCVSASVHLQCFCVYTYMHMRRFVHAQRA